MPYKLLLRLSESIIYDSRIIIDYCVRLCYAIQDIVGGG